MSGFIGDGGGILSMKDRRLVPSYQVVRRMMDRISERHSATVIPGGYTSDFWPGNCGFSGEQNTDWGVSEATWSRTLSRIAHGEASRLGFTGVARDQYGTPLAGVTCSLFLTATKAWIMDVISGSDGRFLLQTFYSPDTHFIVFYKAGAPSVFGTTEQTLIGS